MLKFYKILVLLSLCLFLYAPQSLADIKATASSVQEDKIGQKAMDGIMTTRWSSEFQDNQWLEIDLQEVKTISGMTIYWETAYTEHYKILLSEDGKSWKKVYEEKRGDGSTDIIYFKPEEARFIKLACLKRATGWGNSIWEIKLKGKEEYPEIEASSFAPPNKPSNIMDGDFESFWLTDQKAPQYIIADLKGNRQIGGFRISWGSEYAKSYKIQTSFDKNNWKTVYKTTTSNGKTDYAYIDVVEARYIKILCEESNDKGFSIKELIIKDKNEHATPEKYYEVLAEESPAGYFPKWVYKKQIFWTVTGTQSSNKESLISSSGTVEPFNDTFTLMPYLYLKDEGLVTSAKAKVTQHLDDNFLPIPSVRWDYNELILEEKMFTFEDDDNKPVTYLHFKLTNNTDRKKEGNFYLTLRPIQMNPPWQHGRMPKINTIVLEEGKSLSKIRVNGNDALLCLEKVDDFGATYLDKSDIITYVAVDSLPEAKRVKDKEGLASSGLRYSFQLKPKEKKEYYFILPLYESKNISDNFTKKKFNKHYTHTYKHWQDKLSRFEIDIPQKEVIDTLKTNVAYILINKDGPALQPGPRNYNRSWVRDASVMAASLLRTGFSEDVKKYLDWVTKTQRPSGEMPCIVNANGQIASFARDWIEWDGQGAYIFALSEYYRFTKDEEFIEEKFPYVVKALEFLEKIRKRRLTDKYKDTYYYGILPESISHEGYFPAQHSLWDDFWALKGWKDGQYLAEVVGREDLIPWMKKEEVALRHNLLNNIELIQKQENIKYIPGCFDKADFDATSTAISVWPTYEAEYLETEDLMYTLNRYYINTLVPRLKRGLQSAYTPYELRSATAFLLLDEKEKALNMLNYFLKDRRPLNWKHWAEVVHEDYDRPQYIGDMPHAWEGAIYVNLARSLFVYEKGNNLHIAAGVNSKWLESENEVKVENLPTYYGNISYVMTRKQSTFQQILDKIFGRKDKEKSQSLRISIKGKIEGCNDVILHLPDPKEIDYVKVGRKRIEKIQHQQVKIKDIPAKVTVYYKK